MVHGEIKINEKLGLLESDPLKSGFSVGDRVVYTNDYGIEFNVMVCGFSSDSPLFKYGNSVHTCGLNNKTDGHAWWYPVNKNSLRKV